MLNDAVSLAIEIYSFSFHLILLAISQDPEVRAIPEEERDRRRESPREHVIRAIGNDTPMNDPFFTFRGLSSCAIKVRTGVRPKRGDLRGT